MKFLNTICLLLTLAVQTNSQAATFCVSNSNMLELVLDITESNGQDDVIKIKSGNYIPANTFGFRFFLEESFDIEISGSWDNDCSEQSLNPLDTALDGDNDSRVLSFFNNNATPTYTGNIRLSVLSINNGLYEEFQNLNSKSAGLAFEIGSNDANSITLDRLFFSGNRSNLSSALRAGGNKITVKNSIFFDNESDTGTIYSVADDFYFINNTIINNTYYSQFNSGDSEAGLIITSFVEQAFITNNLIWDNYGPDVVSGSNSQGDPDVYLYHNNFQNTAGTYDHVMNNLSADPQLGFLNFTPAITSPLIDQGYAEPSGIIPFPTPFELNWRYGAGDFLSFDRVVNNRVDIGAIEAASELPIFKNGFDQQRGG